MESALYAKLSVYTLSAVATLALFFSTEIFAEKLKEYMGSTEMENLMITTLDGNTSNLKEFLGKKPVYLKFWASWCQPCREQMPNLQEIYDKYQDKVEIVAVNIGINDGVDTVEATKKEFSLTVPLAIDKSGELAQIFNLRGTPYHILIDIDGKIVFKGTDKSEEFDEAIHSISVSGSNYLPNLSVEKTVDDSYKFEVEKEKYTGLFFTSTWCDWYLNESRPKMSTNCFNAQNKINDLSKKYTDINWIGVVSRLWTGESDLSEYIDKYKIGYSVHIDETNKQFFKHGINKFPTFVLLKNGEEIFRTSEFSDPTEMNSLIAILEG